MRNITMRLNPCFVIGLACTWIVSAAASAGGGPPVLTKFLADDGAEDNEFGYRVAISGGTAIVGTGFLDFSSAYLFDVATGQQLFRLPIKEGYFGDTSVAISNDVAIVGTSGLYSTSLPGMAYLFDVATGQQLFELTADDGEAGEQFGHSVDISGGIAIVGAVLDDDQGLASGSAYLFDVSTGQQLFKLTAENGQFEDSFGASVAIADGIAVVGAPFEDSASGSAYLFDVATGLKTIELRPDDNAEKDFFGASVAVSDGVVIVGAPGEFIGTSFLGPGSAYLFDVTTGQQLFELTADDGADGDMFGISVSISGGIAVVGASLNDDHGADSGSAYLFDVATGRQITKLVPDDGASEDEFGVSVAASDGVIVVGAWHDDDQGADSGSAYLVSGFGACTAADLAPPFGEVNFFDLSAYLGFYNTQDPAADLAAPFGQWNIFDIAAYLGLYNAGCP